MSRRTVRRVRIGRLRHGYNIRARRCHGSARMVPVTPVDSQRRNIASQAMWRQPPWLSAKRSERRKRRRRFRFVILTFSKEGDRIHPPLSSRPECTGERSEPVHAVEGPRVLRVLPAPSIFERSRKLNSTRALAPSIHSTSPLGITHRPLDHATNLARSPVRTLADRAQPDAAQSPRRTRTRYLRQ